MPIIFDNKSVSQSIYDQLLAAFYLDKAHTSSYVSLYQTSEYDNHLAIIDNDNLKSCYTIISKDRQCKKYVAKYQNDYFFEDNEPNHLIKFLKKHYNETLSINLSSSDETNNTNSDETEKLAGYSLANALSNNLVYVLHNNIGWQQFCNQYLYRGIVDLILGAPPL